MRARGGAGAAVLLLCAGVARAADPGFYFGLSVGTAKYDFETPRLPVATPNPGGPIGPPPAGGTDPIAGDPAVIVADVHRLPVAGIRVSTIGHVLGSASIFAAQMKSFSDRPPIACVL